MTVLVDGISAIRGKTTLGLGVSLALLLVSLLGCTRYRALEFRLNTEGRDSASISTAQRESMEEVLRDLFGTPDEPLVPQGVSLDLEKLRRASGPMMRDLTGVERGLYRKLCVVCHGISGDGAGPMAGLLNPYPRDFRQGIFKYTSTVAGAKPTFRDLEAMLQRGTPGTGMPSFKLLPNEDLDCLIEYVKYLSLRGETELGLLRLVVDENEPLPLDKYAVLDDIVLPSAEFWELPEQDPATWVIVPQRPKLNKSELVAAIARGRQLYLQPRCQCVTCHGPEGRGDGEQTDLYDDWNKPKKGVTDQQTRELAQLYALPLQRLKARNFHHGLFHGGDQPEDIFLRIYVGIKGTPMPSAGAAPGIPGVLTNEEIWDLVFYILSLSHKLDV